MVYIISNARFHEILKDTRETFMTISKTITVNYVIFKCSRSTELGQHLKRHYKKDMICGECDYTCSSSGDFEKHKKAFHNKVRDNHCHLYVTSVLLPNRALTAHKKTLAEGQ